MNDIHDDFAALVKRLQMERLKTPQRDAAVQMLKQSQAWVRAMDEAA